MSFPRASTPTSISDPLLYAYQNPRREEENDGDKDVDVDVDMGGGPQHTRHASLDLLDSPPPVSFLTPKPKTLKSYGPYSALPRRPSSPTSSFLPTHRPMETMLPLLELESTEHRPTQPPAQLPDLGDTPERDSGSSKSSNLNSNSRSILSSQSSSPGKSKTPPSSLETPYSHMVRVPSEETRVLAQAQQEQRKARSTQPKLSQFPHSPIPHAPSARPVLPLRPSVVLYRLENHHPSEDPTHLHPQVVRHESNVGDSELNHFAPPPMRRFYGSGSGSRSLGVGSVSSVSSRHSIMSGDSRIPLISPSPGVGTGAGAGTGSHHTGLLTPHAHPGPPGYPGTPGSSVPVLVAYAYQLDALYDSDEDDGEDDDWLHDPRVSFYAAVDSAQMGPQGKGKGRGKRNEDVVQSELESQMKTRSGTTGYVEDTMSLRGLGNYFAIWLLLLGLVALFIFYPVLTAPSYPCVVRNNELKHMTTKMQLFSRTSKILGQPAFVALLLSAIALAVPITGPETYPNEPTPSALSASHDPAHRSDIVSQSAIDARTSELSADDQPLLLARAPEPGATLSQIKQGTYARLAANVKCKNPENQDATRLALEKMLNCDPVHNHLKNALPKYKFRGVLLRKFEIDAGIGDPKYSLDENRLNFKDQHCDVEIIPDEYISLTLWATLRFTKHAPHDQTPYHAALGTVSKYRGNREAVTVVWVEFKMGNIVSEKEKNKQVPDVVERDSSNPKKKT
ncbi:hypothetical protein F5880DRAFT_1504321 [Lentinula raphanica]|nr:hypothetical protein F5880DRAFT_1504321 [Lentinula raphanica]